MRWKTVPRPAARCPCGCCGWRPTPRPQRRRSANWCCMHPAARWTAAGKWNGWTRNFTSTRCVPSAPPTAPPLRWRPRRSAAKSCCGSWTPTPATKTTRLRAVTRGKGSCCKPLIQRSSRPRPCRITRAGRFPPGAARCRCWVSRFYCRAGRCLRTRGCDVYFAAVCTPRYGSRILRWNCLPH